MTELMTTFATHDQNWMPVHDGSNGRDIQFLKPTYYWVPIGWTNVFVEGRWPTAKDWQVQDLGYQEINGIRAHGHRWWHGPPGSTAAGNFKELWFSEDLKVDVLYVEENESKGKGQRAELANFRSREPDPGMFKVGNDSAPAHTSHVEWNTTEPCPASSP